MSGKSCQEENAVSVPRSSLADVRDLFFEQSSSYWYHLFVVFWSRHSIVSDACDANICSRCLITAMTIRSQED